MSEKIYNNVNKVQKLSVKFLSFLSIISVYLFLIFIPLEPIANVGGSAGGYSSSPGDGNDCTSCHSGLVNSGNGSIQLSTNIPVTGYIPGQTYSITTNVYTPTSGTVAMIFGFETTSEDNSNNKIGTFVITDTNNTQLSNSSTSVTHTLQGTNALFANTQSWSFEWVAPISGTGDVTFYTSVNIANFNGGPNGDEIYTSSISFSESSQNNTACNLSLLSVSNVQCYGSNDGVITVEADSGGGVYHYYIEMYNSSFPLNGGWQSVGQVPAPGQYTTVTTVPFTSLPADTFRVILEDTANQCFDTIGYPLTTIIVNEPSQIINSSTVQSTTTPLTPDGSISISPSGGVLPYTFSWQGPNGYNSSIQNLTNLFSGIYYLQITDSGGCIYYDTITLNANQACGLGSFSSVPPVCFGDANGQIVVNSVFGSTPFNYQLEVQDSITMNWNGVTSTTITDTFYTFNNLYAGVYRYSIIDASGCVSSSPPINVQDPTQITSNNSVMFTTSSTSCNGEIITNINGGVAPISHFWSGPSGFVSNSPNLTNLCVGTYCDSIVDANGCSVVICDVVDFEPPCSPEVEVTNIFCDEDSSGIAIVTKTNNAYPLFAWLNSFGDTLSMDTFALNLPEGNYTFNAFNLGVPNAWSGYYN